MKTWNFTFLNSKLTVVYKSFIAFFLLLLAGSTRNSATAQCPGGYNQVTLNWDYLDYFTYSGNYSTGYLTALSQAETQNFSFGTQRLTIATTGATLFGEDNTQTADAGMDVYYDITSGTITLTFEQEVRNLRFSVYDIDRRQIVTVNGKNALNVDVNTQLTRRTGTSILTLAPLSGLGTNPQASAPNTGVAFSSNDGTIDVDIAGPVRTVTITVSNSGAVSSPALLLSNIVACSIGSFPTNYYSIAQPFTGQTGYVLHAFNDSVFAVNPANGVTKFLFEDATDAGYVNSMGYDPYNHILYYVKSLTGSASTNRRLKKYDFSTGTISTLVADINTLGIPTTSTGVESGAGAFYNGAFYLGVEVTNGFRDAGRETIIWRIDFDGSNIPYRASQVFALPHDDGAGTLQHDWADFVINNGILYDFDASIDDPTVPTYQDDIYHFNMLTGATTNFTLPTTSLGWTPGQNAVDWNGNIYTIFSYRPTLTSVIPAVNPYISLYNPVTGTIGTRFTMTSTPAYTPAIPSLGDAAEAFRPQSDFGDAPNSYHGLPGTPLGVATHEYDANLRLGNTFDREWNITTSANADADGSDEDAIGAAPALNYNGSTSYSVTGITVYNNTGANATLIGWLDHNLNGTFEAGEGRSITVPTNAAPQTVSLNWTGITVPNFIPGTTTFLRLRLTRAANGMTTANMNSYYADGEVEDFPVLRGANLLPIQLFDFAAEKINGKQAVKLSWKFSGADQVTDFVIERSADAANWNAIGNQVHDITNSNIASLSHVDNNALNGKSYYRLRWMEPGIGAAKYSTIKMVAFGGAKNSGMEILLNPATSHTIINVTVLTGGGAGLQLLNSNGKPVMQKNLQLHAGENTIRLDGLEQLSSGLYIVRLQAGVISYNGKLLVSK